MIRRSILKALALSPLIPGRGKTMPFGESRGQGFNNPSKVFANQVIVFGPGQGVFVYNGTPALGNPPVISLTGGTVDPYGNTVFTGVETNDGAGDVGYMTGGLVGFHPNGSNADALIQGGEIAGLFLITNSKVNAGDTPGQIEMDSAVFSGVGVPVIRLLATQTQLVSGKNTIPASSAGVTTVAQVLTMLRNVGICT